MMLTVWVKMKTEHRNQMEDCEMACSFCFVFKKRQDKKKVALKISKTWSHQVIKNCVTHSVACHSLKSKLVNVQLDTITLNPYLKLFQLMWPTPAKVAGKSV